MAMLSHITHVKPQPRAWLTLDYWRLQNSRASCTTRGGWSNEDVDVVAKDKRTWRELDYLWLWLADGANVGTMQQAGSILALGLSWGEAAIAIAIGNIIIGLAVALNGSIGSSHHIPFAIASIPLRLTYENASEAAAKVSTWRVLAYKGRRRASMGFYFSYFAVASRLVLGLIYFGINSYIGASCMLIMLEAIWPSLKTYPNALPSSSGIASNKMIAYFVFWVDSHFSSTISPPHDPSPEDEMALFVKSICAIVAAFAMLGWAVKAGGQGPVFDQSATVSGSGKSWAWVYSVNVAVSGKTTLALNISDLTRYGNKPSVAYWQALFIPIVYWLFSFIGIVIASAGQSIYGTLYWDPTSIIGLWTNRAAAFFCAFAFGLATLGTNISTNSIAASNDFAFLFPRWLNLRRGAVITALLGGLATAPWKIQASATSLTTFLSGYIIVMAPIVAIMVSDYWVFRRQRLHVSMLYQRRGIYAYSYGINWRALVTLLVVVPINLPGLMHAINGNIDIGNYSYFYKASWFTATFIAIVVYMTLSLVWPPVNSLRSAGESGHHEEEEEEVDANSETRADHESPSDDEKHPGHMSRALHG